jgi:tRNA A-37 threonylcarbamoyl transferase component Bud32
LEANNATMKGVAASESGVMQLEDSGCLATDDVLGHLDRRLEGARLQAVRDHLDVCGACRVVMAEAARLSISAAPSRALKTLADGETVAGRYEIRRFVARGGMGEVYEAFDSALGEVVALKTIGITSVDQADAVKRLLAEVRIARKVTHPNVCRILEFGTHQRSGSSDEPVPFLTMPLLQGETLASRIERTGRLPAFEALRILGELAAGLAAVHQVGVVHRDFKSDNVFMVRSDDGSERAVVMDFGLARALETKGDKNRTTGRVLIGTPAYMAPEQVEGKTITRAVDVYAFGVVAFELLTGRVPFVAESAAAIALARLQREPAPPSSLVPDLDRAWDGIVQRCLKRAPEQRYRDMAELADALDRLRAGARRLSWRRAMAWALITATAALVASAAVMRAPRPGATARTPEALAGDTATAPLPPRAAPAVSVDRAAGGDLAPATPPRPVKRERPTVRAKRSSASPTASLPSPAPASALGPAPSPANSAPPPADPFDQLPPPRPRQPDDLVDPF